jgi:membrane protein DedA with SNARE-associated domain
MIHRWGHYLRINMEAIDKMERVLFGQNATRVLFMAKLSNALVIPALIAAGILRMGWGKMMRSVVPAQLIWSLGLTGTGFIMADSFVKLSQKIEHLTWAVGIIGGVLVASYLLYRWWKTNQEMVY